MTHDSITQRFPDIERLRPIMRAIAQDHPTPLYVYDSDEVRKNYRAFVAAFQAQHIPMDVYYATKSNPYIGVLRTVVEEGGGLDISSPRELALALEAKAKRIIFTGPAKSEADFRAILPLADRIMVNLESLRELRLLSRIASEAGQTIRCGVRVCCRHQQHWKKFGIALETLSAFLQEARTLAGIRCCGIHYHVSHDGTPERSVQTIDELGEILKQDLSPEELQHLEYLDIGGGFAPHEFEGKHSWNPEQETLLISEGLDVENLLRENITDRYITDTIVPIEEFVAQIGSALRRSIFSLQPNIHIFTEPGRYLCHSAMHMLLTLVEKKSKTMGIADGGVNMVGWEKYECYYYVPIFNLTHFSLNTEIPFLLYGSLCTPDDVWGYSVHCSSIKEGDVVWLPYQGAYTFTTAATFIRDIPPVIDLPTK